MGINGVNVSDLAAMQGALTGETKSAADAAATEGLYEVAATNAGDQVDLSANLKKAADGKIDTLEELNELLTSSNSEEIKALEAKIAQLTKKINQLKADIEKYEQQLNESQKNIDEANKTIKDTEADYIKEQETLDKLQDKQEKKAEEFEDAEQQLKQNQEDLQNTTIKMEAEADNFERDMINEQETYRKLMESKYNPDEDGDFETYMVEKMKEFSPSANAGLTLTSLQNEANTLQGDIKSGQNDLVNLGSNLSHITDDVNASIAVATELGNELNTAKNMVTAENSNLSNLQGFIDAAKAEIATTEPQVAEQQALLSDAKFVAGQNYGKISEAEWKVVQDNKIDLTEKLPNGDARYIIAAGANDNNWHIYDMKANGASVVRQHAEKSGFDIIESGNGYMRNYTEKSKGDGKIVYSISADQSQLDQANACYTTTSPLAFDLEGDGIKTGVIITYDIDGDGQMDNINDVSDAILVFDSNNDGISGSDGTELFGNNTDIDGDGIKENYKDGFAALKALAKNLGLIGENDNTLDANDLKILEEEKGLKMKTGGYNSEAQSLADLGITEINLAENDSTVMTDDFDGKGNQLMTQEGATFKVNGKTRTYADVWHQKLSAGANFEKLEGAQVNQVAQFKENNYESRAQITVNDAQRAVNMNKNTMAKIDELLEKYLNK